MKCEKRPFFAGFQGLALRQRVAAGPTCGYRSTCIPGAREWPQSSMPDASTDFVRTNAHARVRAPYTEGSAEVTPAMPTPACDSHLNHRDGSLGGPWGGCRRRPNSFCRERAHFVAKNVFPWSLRSKRKRAHAAPTALSTKLRCFVRLLHSLGAPEADRLDAVAAIPQPTPASGPYGRLREDGTNRGDGHPWPETRARSGPVIVPGPWA